MREKPTNTPIIHYHHYHHHHHHVQKRGLGVLPVS
jgi:hypothetical protein